MTKNIMRKLWWVPALAVLAACEPYDDERGGTPVVLAVMASPILDPDAPEDGADEAILDADGIAPWALTAVPAGQTVFVVKANKLLDGASIQVSPESCVRSATLNLTVNAAPAPADWFACYVPTAGTEKEGASVVIYQGADIVPGIAGVGRGYLEQANIAAGNYTITAQPRDKSGNVLDISFTAAVL